MTLSRSTRASTLTKASSQELRKGMRSLSPRMDPPDTDEEGSTGSTATLLPLSKATRPRDSIRVDLPAPGGPQTPSRKELRSLSLPCRARRSSRCLASALSRGSRLSTSVMQRERTPRSPLNRPSNRRCMAEESEGATVTGMTLARPVQGQCTSEGVKQFIKHFFLCDIKSWRLRCEELQYLGPSPKM